MQKYLFFVIFILFSFKNATAQSGTWTWMHGSDTNGSYCNYGVLGMPADSNVPCGRYQSAYWTDKQGNFWMFGGVIFTATYPKGIEINDMWKFNPLTNQWTWMNGAIDVTDLNGEFGTKGLPSTANYPSGRGWGVNCWTDTNGMLWLYGGFGSDSIGNRGDLSDLWKFNPNTNEWTWMKGSSTIYEPTNYGTQNIYADSVTPGSLQEVKSSWVDKQNTVHIFGGKHYLYWLHGYSYETSNDVWQFDQSINQWRWRKGNNAVNIAGHYGTIGLEDTANYPPARCSYTKWVDAAGNFYIFGGAQIDNQNNFNDTWKYNPNTNAWTWVDGPNVPNTSIPYPNYCTQKQKKYPAPRLENQTAQTDICVNAFWSFGGIDYESNFYNIFNDLWLYNALDADWIRVSGKDTGNFIGNYGIKKIPSTTNEIGARFGVAIWVDKLNNLWIFGGWNYDGSKLNNDLWRFVPDTNCFKLNHSLPIPKPLDTIICKNQSTKIIGLDTIWDVHIYPSLNTIFNANKTEILFTPNATTNYTLTAVDKRMADCYLPDTLYFKIQVDSFLKPNITISNFTICPNTTYTIALDTNYHYTWQNNANIITNTDTSILSTIIQNQTTFIFNATYKNSCSLIDTFNFTGNILPTILPVISIPNTSTCKGDTIPIAINQNYQISVLPNQDFFTNADTTMLYLTPQVSTNYIITVQNMASPCKAVQTFFANIFIGQPQQLQIGPFTDYKICVGDSVMLTMPSGMKLNITPNTYKQNGDNYYFTPTTNTIYTITAVATNACQISTSAILIINTLPNPTADFITNPTYFIKPNSNVQLINKSTNAIKYNWYLNFNNYLSSLINTEYNFTDTGKYCFTLVAYNNLQCRDTATHCVNYIADTNSVITVPNVFTPNNDNVNDVFYIIGHNITLQNFSIFDRWGEKLFETNDITKGWLGTYKGKRCELDNYFYIIKYKTIKGEDKILKGDVLLMQ